MHFHLKLPSISNLYDIISRAYTENKSEIDKIGFITFDFGIQFDINNMPPSFAERTLGDIWPDMDVDWQKTEHIPYGNGHRLEFGQERRIAGNKIK